MNHISVFNKLARVDGLIAPVVIKVNPSADDTIPVNTSYLNILRLAQRLEIAGVPYDLHRLQDGWQLCFYYRGKRADIIENRGSFGGQMDLMESMGFKEDKGDVSGYLEIEDCLARIANFFM